MNKIKRILLVNPPIDIGKTYGQIAEFSSVTAPVWACYIASILEKDGYDVDILDAEAEKLDFDTTIKRIVDYHPDLVGFSCMTSKVVDAHTIAKSIKEILPGVLIVAGGPHISAVPDRTLDEFPFFDILVVGEGEITTRELVNALNKKLDLKEIDGIFYRDQNNQKFHTKPRQRVRNLDELPFPAYDKLPELKKYYWPYFNNVQGYPAFSLISSRGCPFQCKFCDRKVFGNSFTKHSPKYFAELIDQMVNKYGIKYLVFDDDNMTLDKNYLFGILDELKARKIKVPFTCESRVDTVDDEKLERLRKSGCKEIMYGIESGSPRILELMNKQVTTDQIREAIKMTKKHGISTFGYFMLGFPGETEESMKETVGFIKELKLFDVAVQPFVPFPGSDIYDYAVNHGTLEGRGKGQEWNKMGSFSEIIYLADGITKEKLIQYLNEAIDACYGNIRTYATMYKRVHSWKHLSILIKMLKGVKGGIWK